METVLFRVDGGKVWGISMGHLKRSLLLANVLREKKRVVFVMKKYPDGVAFIKGLGFEVETMDIENNGDDLLMELCRKYSPKQVILDLVSNHYPVFFEYARMRNIQTVVFDSFGECSGFPDILINDSFVGKFTEYLQLKNKTRLYTGPQYFLIDNTPEIVPLRDTARDIAITLGGSDPANLTVKILSAFLDSFEHLNLHVILGPSYTDQKTIYRLSENKKNIRFFENPNNFLELLSHQDIVICAAGRTLYECAYLGRPAIIVPSIEHEEVTASEYAKITGSFNIGPWDYDTSCQKLSDALCKYQNCYKLRKSVFNSCKHVVDGHGLKRVLSLIT